MSEVSKELKKQMDKEIRQYWDNKKKLENLRNEIIEESGSSDGQPKSKNAISDSTSKKAIKLISTRRLLVIEERLRYIENTVNRLKPFEKDVFIYIFKQNYSWQYCESLGIPKTTYYNIYNKIINICADEFGMID